MKGDVLMRAGLATQTRWIPRVTVPETEEHESQPFEWSFDAVFEGACKDAGVMLSEDRPFRAFLVVGLKDGPIVVMPYSWRTNAEKVRLYDHLSSRYQGKAEFYVHASECPARGDGLNGSERSRMVRVLGMDRSRKPLARLLEFTPGTVPAVVVHEDSSRGRETLPDVLFKSYREPR
jgi:hypothetical protein